MADIRKVHIHHRDGNPLNNNPSNWQVLCSKCHSQTFSREKKNEHGFQIVVIFKPWLRERILKAAHYRCQQCGTQVGDIKHKRCNWCGRITTKANRVEWKDGRTMCKECFDDWTEQGGPREFSPLSSREKNHSMK